MNKAIIGKKLGMTQVFLADGTMSNATDTPLTSSVLKPLRKRN